MYKKLMLTVALLCFGSAMFAQSHEDQWIWPDEYSTDEIMFSLDAGPAIGGGMSFATSPTILSANFSNGLFYQFGIAVNGRIVHRMSPKPHGISRIGAGMEMLLSKSNINTESEALGILCLDIPIMLHCYMASNFYFEAGVTLVKSLIASPDWLQLGPIMLHSGDISYSDAMFSVGASYKTPSNLAFGLRYNHGTSNLAENLDSKTSNVVFSISYKFPIVK